MTSLSQLIRSYSARANQFSNSLAGSYFKALQSYWRGDFQAAATTAADCIADEPDGEAVLMAYRLWIESLGEMNDRSSLRCLITHLLRRGQTGDGNQPHFAALRGLTHFELDEINAASMIANAFTDAQENPYSRELQQRIANRLENHPAQIALLGSTTPIVDYFHWLTLSRTLVALGRWDDAAVVMAHIEGAFPGSTASSEFEFHRYAEVGQYSSAALVASGLHNRHIERADYAFNLGYSLFHAGQPDEAREILASTLKLTGDSDPDVFTLLGETSRKLGELDKASQYMQRAIGVLKENGLPSTSQEMVLRQICEDQDESTMGAEEFHHTRMWLIKLSSSEAYELKTAPSADIETLYRPMGIEPKAGDYCFFASDSSIDREDPTWKVIGIYTVESDPVWHPLHRHETALRIVSRQQIGVPVDVKIIDEETVAEAPQLPRDHHFNYGVFELEVGALEIIAEAARDLNERRTGIRTAQRDA